MSYLLNFMPYLYKMTKQGMDDFAELIGVRLTREQRRDSKDYCFRKLQHFFFEIYKMDLTCYDIEFPGFWRMGLSNFDGVRYVRTKDAPHPCCYDIIESILNDPTGNDQIKEFRRIYKQIDYTDFVGMIRCYDHSGGQLEYHDILSCTEGETTCVIELTGMPPLQPLRPPRHSAAASSADSTPMGQTAAAADETDPNANGSDPEPLPEDDVEWRSYNNIYISIPTFNRNPVPQDSR